MKNLQRGNVIVGIIIGVVLGLAAALAVAVYVTKVPVPFLNKGPSRSAEQDAAESRKNQNWDPNAPLYGKNPAKALPAAPSAIPNPDDPAAYKPKTQFDNTPWRFNMNQNGKKMTAEEFDAWMKAKGVRVVKGKTVATPPPAAEAAPTPPPEKK